MALGEFSFIKFLLKIRFWLYSSLTHAASTDFRGFLSLSLCLSVCLSIYLHLSL